MHRRTRVASLGAIWLGAVAASLTASGAAAAAAIPVKGPKTIKGTGPITLTLAGPKKARLALTSSGTQTLRLVDRQGNLTVRCLGSTRRVLTGARRPSADGGADATRPIEVVECVGKNAGASVIGSQLVITLDAKRYQVTVPAGYSGSYEFGVARPFESPGGGQAGAAFVACMKKHGVELPTGQPSGDRPPFSRDDPKVQEALEACRKLAPPANGGADG